MELINVTNPGAPLAPGNKYRYLKDNGTYTATQIYDVTPYTPSKAIRKISVGAFRRRLTLAEKVLIEQSTDPTVKVLLTDLNTSSFIDLDFPVLISGLQYLAHVAEVLDPSRIPELLVDGIEEEV